MVSVLRSKMYQIHNCHPGLRAGIQASVFFLLALPLAGHAITTETGKSFFSPQPLSTILAPLNNSFEHFSHDTEPEGRFSLSVAPFFFKSTNPADIRRSIFPEGKNELIINGSEVPGNDFDLSGTWLQIAAPFNSNLPMNGGFAGGALVGNFNHNLEILYNAFQSKLTVIPEYRFYGLHCAVAKIFSLGNCDLFFDLNVPVGVGLSSLNTQEEGSSSDRKNVAMDVGGIQGNIDLIVNQAVTASVRLEPLSSLYSMNAIDALSHSSMNFSKWSSKVLKREGIGDVAIKCGVGSNHWALYLKGTVPTSEQPSNEFIGEPLLGNGAHWGTGLGAKIMLGKKFESCELSLKTAAEYEYLWSASQLRTYDLDNSRNGAMSRYLLMQKFTPGAPNSTVKDLIPGVNLLTLPTRVTPNHTAGFSVDTRFERNNFFLALDYNFKFLNEEQLVINADPATSPFNVASLQLRNAAFTRGGGGGAGDFFGIPVDFFPSAHINTHGGTTAQVPQDPAGSREIIISDITKSISLNDLDIESARQSKKLSSTLGLSGGFKTSWHGFPAGLTMGYSRSLGHSSGVLEGWTAWLQFNLVV